MKIVIYSQQGNDTLSGVHADIIFDFISFKNAIVIKTESDEIAHFVSCKDIESIGIWRTSELECAFISACKNGKPLFMIVPDNGAQEGDLQYILKKCLEKIQN